MKRQHFIQLIVAMAVFISGFLVAPAADASRLAAESIQLRKVTFAHGLTDDFEPIDPGNQFFPDETVYLSVQIAGRPKSGIVTAEFFLGEQYITETELDLADINAGLLFSIGQDTYVGYTLSHSDPFPISPNYRADVSYEGQALGSYGFEVIPPVEAIPTQINALVLARGVDDNYNPIDPTDVFAYDEKVYLIGHGDLGLSSWLEARWYVNGSYDEDGTRSITLNENLRSGSFSFSFLPAGGWPTGAHEVALAVNDTIVATYPFTVALHTFDLDAFVYEIPFPDDAEFVDVSDPYIEGFVTSIPASRIFEAYGEWLQGEGWTPVPPTQAIGVPSFETWTTKDAQITFDIRGQDEQGRNEVWFKITRIWPDVEAQPTDSAPSATFFGSD